MDDRIAHIPHELTYLLPPGGFEGNIVESFVRSTTTSDASINDLLRSAIDKPFISYSDEFLQLLGPSPTIQLVDSRESNFAGEAGVWIPERHEVWYTTWINDGPTHVEILDLHNKTVRKLECSPPLENPNGGFYFKGLVYFACLRDDSRGWPGGVMSVEPATGEVKTVLNSYFGLKFDAVDDVAWVTKPGTEDEDYMFITILPLPEGMGNTENTLPQGLWRWDPMRRLLLPAISRTEYPVANGVRPTKDGGALWLTDFGGEERSRVWGLPAKVGAPAVYRYDLDQDMWPTNKRIFSVARMQAPDGIRVDDEGRVWTAEGEGVVVRDQGGKVLGVFNAHYFTRDPVKMAIVQFELAADTLVILGMNKLWMLKLGEVMNKA